LRKHPKRGVTYIRDADCFTSKQSPAVDLLTAIDYKFLREQPFVQSADSYSTEITLNLQRNRQHG